MAMNHSALEFSSRPTSGSPNREKQAAPPLSPKFKDATRLQRSVSGGLERRALIWFAERIPAWVNSDQLTLLGFASMFLAGCSYALARWNHIGLMLASGCLVLNWFGDSLDGTLARVRKSERPRYGFYVDHMIDSFGALFLMGGLAVSGYADWRIAAGMLAAFLMLSIEVYLAAYTIGIFRLSYWKLGPTEIRILLALANTLLWLRGDFRVLGSPYRLFDVGGVVAMVGMGVMLIAAVISHTARLYREETHRPMSGIPPVSPLRNDSLVARGE
jgi:archaetidylinositol phosphate synthase